MSDQTMVLGMPLDTALALVGEAAKEIRIVRTDAPRSERKDGTLRVIRVRPGEWTVSAFHDAMPGSNEA